MYNLLLSGCWSNWAFQFQEVLAIGLPERSDKRDLLTLMSTFQDVKLTWMNAIKGGDISRKVWPNVRRRLHVVVFTRH